MPTPSASDLARGKTPAPTTTVKSPTTILKEDDLGGNLAVGAGAAINEALLGIPQYLTKAISPETGAAWEKAEAEHPTAKEVGGILGLIGSVFIPGGLATKGAGAALKAAGAATKVGELEKAGKTVAKAGEWLSGPTAKRLVVTPGGGAKPYLQAVDTFGKPVLEGAARGGLTAARQAATRAVTEGETSPEDIGLQTAIGTVAGGALGKLASKSVRGAELPATTKAENIFKERQALAQSREAAPTAMEQRIDDLKKTLNAKALASTGVSSRAAKEGFVKKLGIGKTYEQLAEELGSPEAATEYINKVASDKGEVFEDYIKELADFAGKRDITGPKGWDTMDAQAKKLAKLGNPDTKLEELLYPARAQKRIDAMADMKSGLNISPTTALTLGAIGLGSGGATIIPKLVEGQLTPEDLTAGGAWAAGAPLAAGVLGKALGPAAIRALRKAAEGRVAHLPSEEEVGRRLTAEYAVNAAKKTGASLTAKETKNLQEAITQGKASLPIRALSELERSASTVGAKAGATVPSTLEAAQAAIEKGQQSVPFTPEEDTTITAKPTDPGVQESILTLKELTGREPKITPEFIAKQSFVGQEGAEEKTRKLLADYSIYKTLLENGTINRQGQVNPKAIFPGILPTDEDKTRHEQLIEAIAAKAVGYNSGDPSLVTKRKQVEKRLLEIQKLKDPEERMKRVSELMGGVDKNFSLDFSDLYKAGIK